MRLRGLAADRVRFGYRRLTMLLRREVGGRPQADLQTIYRGRADAADENAQEIARARWSRSKSDAAQ